MIKRIDHIGIAVNDLEKVIKLYKNKMGFQLLGIEEVESQKVRVAKFDIDGVHIEFLEPLDQESPIYKYIQKKGEGIHHIAYLTDSIEEEMASLKNNGLEFINDTPVIGSSDTKIAFIHPKSVIVLTELVQKENIK